MTSRKKKFYVVWEGTSPGVYSTWADCESAIKGYSNAKYKSFPTLASAEKAFGEAPGDYWGTGKFVSPLSDAELAAIGQPIADSLCVDRSDDILYPLQSFLGVPGNLVPADHNNRKSLTKGHTGYSPSGAIYAYQHPILSNSVGAT